MATRNLLIAFIGIVLTAAVFVAVRGGTGQHQSSTTTAAMPPVVSTPAPPPAPARSVRGQDATITTKRHSTKKASGARRVPRPHQHAATHQAPAHLSPAAATLVGRGYRALADLAVAGDGLTITYAGLLGKTVLVNVHYSGTRAFARTAWLAFLHHYGDIPAHYRVRWIGPAAKR